jgi:peptidoglycan hydrolase CwlO-like protein
MNEVVITALVSALTTIGGFFLGKRKSNAETDSIVIQNVKELLGVYSNTINDLKNEIKELKEKIDKYEEQIDNMSLELTHLRKELQK